MHIFISLTWRWKRLIFEMTNLESTKKIWNKKFKKNNKLIIGLITQVIIVSMITFPHCEHL